MHTNYITAEIPWRTDSEYRKIFENFRNFRKYRKFFENNSFRFRCQIFSKNTPFKRTFPNLKKAKIMWESVSSECFQSDVSVCVSEGEVFIWVFRVSSFCDDFVVRFHPKSVDGRLVIFATNGLRVFIRTNCATQERLSNNVFDHHLNFSLMG